MKFFDYFLLLLCCIIFASPIKAEELLADHVAEERAREVFSILKCAVCQGQSIKDSNSEIASAMRQSVRSQIIQGKSEKEIIASFERSYGEEITFSPKFKGYTALLWLAPLLIFSISIVLVVRQRRL